MSEEFLEAGNLPEKIGPGEEPENLNLPEWVEDVYRLLANFSAIEVDHDEDLDSMEPADEHLEDIEKSGLDIPDEI